MMSAVTFNVQDAVIDIVLNASGVSEGRSVFLDSLILKQILSKLDSFSSDDHHHNPSFYEDDASSQYENIPKSDWEGYLARFLLTIADSNDERISKQIISSILIIHRHLSNDSFLWLFNEFLQYASRKFARKHHHRSTNLGSHTEIDLDDTTGWEHLEANIKGAQTLLIAVPRRSNSSEVFVQLTQQRVSDDSGITVWQLIIVQASQHVNRYIRENTFVFLSSLFEEDSLSFTLLEAVLSCDEPESTLLSTLLDLLSPGLEDDWSQVRYAASQALQACLGKVWSIYHSEKERELVLQSKASSLLPILCLNRFHAAPSIQTISHKIWMEYFNPTALGRRLLVKNVSQTVSYYHKQMQTAKNHMVCEAACHALCELLIRMDYDVIVEFASSSLDVLLDSCLMDERWPVKDAACMSSGRILQRFPLSLPTTSTVSNNDRLGRFVSRFEHHLQDCIASVRENAAVAYVQAMLSSDTEVNDFLLEAAVRYIDKFLLIGTEDEDEQQLQKDGVQQQSRIQSFLPLAMLQKKTENIASEIQPQLMSSEIAGMGVDLNILRAMTSNSSNGPAAVNDMNAMRKGWGCCMDCVELRTAQPWELSHGALWLLREVVINKQPMLLLQKSEQLLSILKKTSCRLVDKLHAAVYEQVTRLLL